MQPLAVQQRGNTFPAILGVKRLGGALPGEGCAAPADAFPVRPPVHATRVHGEEPQALRAVTEFILYVYDVTASDADERPSPLGVINVEPVTAYPAFEDFDVTVAVIDHVTKTTFVAYHGHLAS